MSEPNMSWMQMVEQFHRKFGVPLRSTPGMDDDRAELRLKLLGEEYIEWLGAMVDGDIVAIADALADMAYIICGTALEFGIPLDEVFEEVHLSNMAKVGPDGQVVRSQSGKILKPEGWKPPDIEGVLRKTGAAH